jgi:hypothetical protein
MSVSQVKKRFAEMESYLGRDKEALRRLKLLKDDVNVLRTSLSAAEEKAVEAEAVKEAARKRADDADIVADALKTECDRLNAVATGLEAKAAILTAQLSDAINERHDRNIEPADQEAAFKKMMRDLTKHREYCAESPRNGGKIPKNTMWYNRNDLAHGWSRKEIWALGASIAALVALLGQVVIFTDETVRTMAKKDRLRSFSLPLARWMKKNIRPDGVDEMWDSLTEEQKERYEQIGKQADTAEVVYGRELNTGSIRVSACGKVFDDMAEA